MATFEEVWDLAVACVEDIIDEDEFLLWDFNTLKNLDFPYDNYNHRYLDMIVCFGRPVPVMSIVTNTVLDYIFTTHSQRVLQWNEIYTDAVSLKGAAWNRHCEL